MHGSPDFNLLVTLDVLLETGSVAGAAKRLRLSPSAMSRALARLRETMGDPLLVRAGRKLVPSPRALKIREDLKNLVEAAHSILKPEKKLAPGDIDRIFTIRASDGFVENFGPTLVARIHAEAPRARLRFEQKPIKDGEPLRTGQVDLEIGVIERTTSPELRRQVLYKDRFVGVVRKNHPLTRGRINPARYAAGNHISVSRQTSGKGLVDEALAGLHLNRNILTIIPGLSAAVALAGDTELIATVPERHTKRLCTGMFTFTLPFPTPPITVAMLWHPRLEADGPHQWLRQHVITVCSIS